MKSPCHVAKLVNRREGYCWDSLIEMRCEAYKKPIFFEKIGLACIIHEALEKSSKALPRDESSDLAKKQSVF